MQIFLKRHISGLVMTAGIDCDGITKGRANTAALKKPGPEPHATGCRCDCAYELRECGVTWLQVRCVDVADKPIDPSLAVFRGDVLRQL